MALNARMNPNDPRFYNPSRDLAHNFGHIVKVTASQLERRRWKELEDLLSTANVTDEELGQVCEAMVAFVLGACDRPKEKMDEALERVGWFKHRSAAQVAYLAVLGTVVMGYYYQGVREITCGPDGPKATYGDLMAAGRRCSKLLHQPRWLRWLKSLFRRKEPAPYDPTPTSSIP